MSLSACSKAKQSEEQHPLELEALQAEIAGLTNELDAKEQSLQAMQSQLDRLIGMEDWVVMLMEHSHSIFAAVQANKPYFPVLGVDEGNVVKQQLLREIDLNTIVDLAHNELIIFAYILEDVTPDIDELHIPVTLYRNFETAEEIKVFPEMSVHVKKQAGKWQVVKFVRGN